MRAMITTVVTLMLASPGTAAFAQAGSTPPASAPPASPAPIKSTLKPAPDINADTSKPRQRMVTVFGAEPCPKPTSPDEIVVCARLPASEIYRIPPPLRQANNKRISPFQANRNLLLGDSAGGAGGAIGSCTTVGGSGSIGCTRKDIDAWAKDRASRMGASEPVPPQ